MKVVTCPKCAAVHLIIEMRDDEYHKPRISGFRCTAPGCRHAWSVHEPMHPGELVEAKA